MNTKPVVLTHEVIKDLLTLYLAGEASADTRDLVDSHLARNPELARQVDEARRIPPLPGVPPPPDAELETLARTRQLLQQRSHTLAVAMIFTALPLAFTFDDSGITFLLIRDAPKVGLAWWATAAAMWIAHFWIRRRLRIAGV